MDADHSQSLGPTLPHSHEGDKKELESVDFEENDPENPLGWPYWRKVTIQLLVASMYMLGNFGTVIIAPAVPQIMRDFGVDISEGVYSTLLISIWELGEVFGPFIAGPVSEKFGRLPVYHVGNALFIICSVASGLSTNISMLLAFRFLNGITTTSMTLGPSIVGDCFPVEQRGRSMAVAIAIPMIGPTAGPVIGGYLTARYGWRACFWFVTVLATLVVLLSILFVRETYKPIILERKAQRLRRETGNQALKSTYHARWVSSSFLSSVTRPFRLLFSSPIVSVIMLYNALVYGTSYIILTTLASIMQSVYGFSVDQSGITYVARGLGNLAGMLFYALTSDRYLRMMRRRNGQSKPEDRLPHMLLGAVTIIVGVLLYGWGSDFALHWIVPIMGTALIGFGWLITMLPTQNYLVDLFDLYAASAIAIANALSAIFGTFFPLCAPPLYRNLGLGWGNSVVALIFLVWMPTLVALHHFGERIRTSQRFGIKSEKNLL